MNPDAPSSQSTLLLDQVRMSVICNYYRLKKEEFLFLWDLFYDPLEWSSVRRYATPRKDLPLPTIRSILKQAGL